MNTSKSELNPKILFLTAKNMCLCCFQVEACAKSLARAKVRNDEPPQENIDLPIHTSCVNRLTIKGLRR